MSVEDRLIARLDELVAKADDVLTTHRPNPPNVIGFSTLDSGAFAEWQAQSLSFLINLLGGDHVYVEKFREEVEGGFKGSVRAGQGILRAVREDIASGYLTDLRTLVAAAVFSDFLEMADHLLEMGYHHPAASLAGAVLEDGLRQIAVKHGIKLKVREDLTSLNTKCADASVYSRLVQKKVVVWTKVRNHADHGEFDAYSERDVKELLSGATDFLATYLT